MIAAETKELGILARWYAEPLNHNDAQALLEVSQRREQALLKRHGRSYLSPLLKLVALHWLGERTDEYYHYLTSQHSGSTHLQILKPLLYGQLLMSRRLDGAMQYLDEAFLHARLLLRPDDYFTLMKRHQVLKRIPLSDKGARPESLTELLTTASVIERMQDNPEKRKGFWYDPNDTYG